MFWLFFALFSIMSFSVFSHSSIHYAIFEEIAAWLVRPSRRKFDLSFVLGTCLKDLLQKLKEYSCISQSEGLMTEYIQKIRFNKFIAQNITLHGMYFKFGYGRNKKVYLVIWKDVCMMQVCNFPCSIPLIIYSINSSLYHFHSIS